MYDAEGAAYRRRQSARYLNAIRRARSHIEALNAEIDAHRDMASGVGAVDYSKDMVTTSPSADRMPDEVARLLDIIEERVGAVREYVDMLDECSDALDAMGGREANLLRLHYLAGMPLSKIGKLDEWRHSRQYMSELHLAALEVFADHIPHAYRDPRHTAL